jgi:hypothetical protein
MSRPNFARAVFLMCSLALDCAFLVGCNKTDRGFVIVTVVDPADREMFVKSLKGEQIRFESMPDGALKVYVRSAKDLEARMASYRKWEALKYKAIDLDSKE